MVATFDRGFRSPLCGGGPVRAQFSGLVRRSFQTQSTLQKQPEHCSLDPERLGAIGLIVGSQIRVRKSSNDVALYTISETLQETSDTTVRMAAPARERLGEEDE